MSFVQPCPGQLCAAKCREGASSTSTPWRGARQFTGRPCNSNSHKYLTMRCALLALGGLNGPLYFPAFLLKGEQRRAGRKDIPEMPQNPQ